MRRENMEDPQKGEMPVYCPLRHGGGFALYVQFKPRSVFIGYLPRQVEADPPVEFTACM